MHRFKYLRTVLALAASFLVSSQVHAHPLPGAVYTMDNAASGNHVLAYDRAEDGTLTFQGSYATGGNGSGNGLGNQGGVILSLNGRWLYVVNAGSDEISVFKVLPNGLELTDRVSSRGRRPISLTHHGVLLYVLNAGGAVGASDGINGFIALPWGQLYPLADSSSPLSAANVGPAQISFSPDGLALAVTEKGTGLIDTWQIGDEGMPENPQALPSAGATPFGFAFDRHQHLVVTEANGGAPDGSSLSSYLIQPDASLSAISSAVPTTETAACWVVITQNGRYAYASNAGSGSISGYRIDSQGALKLLQADGVTANIGAGSGPIDLALNNTSRILYSLNGGAHSISAFRVNNNGSLTPLSTTTGLPPGANGLAAR